ncbi:hypothetical protein DNU06_01825 [Putridiphycobacter roseus]|uniref:Uncharacterized protein n=1 Tax=Putridiphycobacter roseus TaxID=2219161 RepID=A0A2W1N421_9FLAO|nr:hypothetical protein [Putridiphycobacter roseus]PZE18594.1 hypothetical protein DNU06_01825 [Putridiphycobacter roseus]
MPGNGSSRCVKVKVYKELWRIDQDCDNCSTFSSELSPIAWNMEAMQVYYAPARSVNLATGICEE